MFGLESVKKRRINYACSLEGLVEKYLGLPYGSLWVLLLVEQGRIVLTLNRLSVLTKTSEVPLYPFHVPRYEFLVVPGFCTCILLQYSYPTHIPVSYSYTCILLLHVNPSPSPVFCSFICILLPYTSHIPVFYSYTCILLLYLFSTPMPVYFSYICILLLYL